MANRLLIHGTFVLLVCGVFASAGVRAVEITVPNPRGFIEASAVSDKVRATATAALSPEARLLGAYYPTNALAEILNHGFSEFGPFCRAVVQREYKSSSAAKKAFATLVANAKKEVGSKFDLKNKNIQLILKNAEQAARKVDPSISVKMKGSTVLGSLIDDETTFAVCMLVNFSWSDGQTTTQVPYVFAVAFTRFDTRQIDFSTHYPFTGESSVNLANQKLTEWLRQVREVNKIDGK